MLDIGWTELLVIAIVLIVVVGPKDLPPMIRAFGRTMANLRKVTGEFRTQFDQALKEADMDDVRKTLSDVQNLNPSNALRDAINPLRQIGNDIRGDLEKSVSTHSTAAPATEVKVPEPQMKLPETAPVVSVPEVEVAAVKPVETKPKKSTKKAAEKSVDGEAAPVKSAPAKRTKKVALSDAKPLADASVDKKVSAKKTPAKKKTEKV